MDISDVALLRRWQQSSDSEAFTLLVMRHSGMVFNTCNRILRNRADAEDVTQECFMELGAVHTLVGNSLGGLLHTLATHRCLDRLKRESRRREREIQYAMGRPSSYTVGWDDIYPHIDEAIASLPVKYRESIIRHFLKGQTHAEIGRELGIADPTVRYRINKGIERVRRDLHRRGITASASVVGTALEESTSEMVSANLAANLGKLSLAGAGNVPSTPRAVPSRKSTLVASKVFGIIVLAALAGLIAWTLKTGTPPIESPTSQVTSTAPVESPEMGNTVPVQVPSVAATVVEEPAPEEDLAASNEQPQNPMPEPATEVASSLPPVESSETEDSRPEKDRVASDEQPLRPTPEAETEIPTPVPPVESPETRDSVSTDDVLAVAEPPLEPKPAPDQTGKMPSVESPVVERPEHETAPATSVVDPEEATPESEPFAVASTMEPIQVELPEAFFGGTPLDYWGPNLEAEDYKERPPFLAPSGTTIISAGKPVTTSSEPTVGTLKQLTDGDKNYAKTSLIELPEGLQWVQIDLEKTSEIYAVLVWHFHEGKRIYFDLVAQVSDDPEFNRGVTTIYNNDYDNSAGLGAGEDKEYIESNKGRLIDAKGVRGRYLRVYGKGSTASDFNHFIEVEVWGK
ncbi:MAG: sigma-70 family RNA polymerase sigma factor [Candidatus Hydrogenedentes bacterium]|nr:sigma-70 family RNA polymerase sigma factor [Candidatus Hydrogenedentota bacterium]